MARPKINLIGHQYGKLTVVKESHVSNNRPFWVCRCSCGTESIVSTGNLRSKHGTQSCGCLRRVSGSKHPAWKGGRTVDGNGYIRVTDPNHPNCQIDGRVLEHVKVMSEHLGRPLVAGENVHHINGVKDDNRPKNLELWVSSHPPGQRAEDLVAWAEEILSLYKPINKEK